MGVHIAKKTYISNNLFFLVLQLCSKTVAIKINNTNLDQSQIFLTIRFYRNNLT